jgi:adenylylsulfate kinase
MLLLMAGLPGTGKSTLARALAKRTGAFVLDKDGIRASLFPATMIEYSREQDDFVVRVMLKVAGWIVRKNSQAVVVIDGRPFSKKYQLDQVIAFAEWVKTPWRIVECTCSEATARRRLDGAEHPAADRNFQLYERVRGEWEEIMRPKLVVNTDEAIGKAVDKIAAYLAGREESNPADITAI